MFDKIPFLKNLGGSLPFFGSSSEEDTGALKTTPVRWRTADGVYVGWSGDVWMYRELVLNPMMWEDAQTRLAMSAPLERLLGDLGATSQDLGGGMATLSRNREIHIASITYEAEARPPEGTPEALRDYLEATLDFLVPTRVLLIGVKLRSSLVSAVAGRSAGKSTLDAVKAQLTQVLSEDVPDLDAYEADMNLVRSILESNGAGRVPSREVLAQLESWYNLGRTTDVTILEAKDCLYVGDVDRIEIAAVTNFDTTQFTAPYATWLLDAMTHPEGASVVSIRAELQPSSVARARIRRGQRKILAQMEEESATGDLERPEHQSTFDALRSAEQFFATTRESILANCSMLLARRVTPEVTETYLDELGDVYGIELKPLEHRQLWALEETLPCSTRRVNPFVQDLTIATIAYAGLQGYSNLGDPTGVFTGLVDPDYIPMYLNPLGAPAADMPPGMLVAGDPGSGKAQPLDAKVLTPTGWTTMGELAVGDEVIGSDGLPHQVLAVYPQGPRPIVKVTFNDGTSAECDEEHLWAVRTSSAASRGTGWKSMSTADLAKNLRDGQGKLRWRVPVVDAVQFPHRDLPIAPYALGLLLGDGGMTNRVSFSSADHQLVAALSEALGDEVAVTHRSNYDYDVVRADGRRSAVTSPLARLGMMDQLRDELRVPTQIRTSTPEQRLRFLDGVFGWSNGGELFTAAAEVIASVAAVATSIGLQSETRSDSAHQTLRCAPPVLTLDAVSPVEDLDPWVIGFLFTNASFRHQVTVSQGAVSALVDRLPSGWEARSISGGRALVTGGERSNPVREALRDLGLFGKPSHEKHIPAEYLLGSVEQRTALLQGLMDTDGTVDGGYPTFCSTSEALINGFVDLVCSLGGTARVSRRPAGIDGSTARPAFIVSMRLPSDIAPFRLTRKLRRLRPNQPTPTRIIESIEPARHTDAQCILVDAPDHLYVTDNYVVTHNTFLCQMIALQSAIAGMATIFINPKGFDTLAPFAQVVDGDVVSMSSLERSAGAFDPFRYADPEQAAEIATSHILSVLGNVGTAGMGFTTAQSVKLGAGLRRGAIAGARCVNDALNYVDDDEVKYLVRELAESNSTFALGIGKTPAEPFVSRNRLTLIEFDRPLDLPEKGVQPSNYSQTQKISIAAMRLVTRASLHILANANGGVLIVDEAWTFLSNQEGLSVLQSMGRLGRSQNILPIFATQRVDDLLREGVDMEGYLSRVFVMKLADEREARAALKLCGLEATQARIDWLRGAGPRRGDDGTPARPAMALHRDLKGRHAAVMIGPVPDTARAAFSTNPEDRKRIREERERAARQHPPEEGQEST